MLTIDALKEYGANTEEGLGRCLGNKEFYFKLIDAVTREPSFDKLEKAVNEDDLDTAFEAAHALKGVLGNLSLTPISAPVCEMTELLRSRTKTDYSAMMAEIKKQRDSLKALLNE